MRRNEQADLEAIVPDERLDVEPARRDWYRIATLLMLGVIAGALVIVANAELRQARVAERRECREREIAREGTFNPRIGAEIAARCGGADLRDRRSALPDVVGLRLVDAEVRLREQGFSPQVVGGDPLGDNVIVWAQEPRGGQQMDWGSSVELRTRR